MTPIQRLEQYTLRYPQEVLLVSATVEGETDEIAIFKGFSSSLCRPTAYDPDIPVLPPEAEIVAIARLQSPYQPEIPHYLEQDISWLQMEQRLQELGL
ncbi:MAG: hypothetical protein AAFY11_02605 [Cyanobacteria bacterium J06641_5]